MRDRKKGEPVPVVADSSLKKGKKYTIAVRVVDVFGNDASVLLIWTSSALLRFIQKMTF